MSASETNIEKQKRRHRGPLVGIAIVAMFSAIMAMAIFWEGTDGDVEEPLAGAPETTTTQ